MCALYYVPPCSHLPMLGALLKSCTSSKGGRNIQEAVLVQFFAILEHLQPSVFCSGEVSASLDNGLSEGPLLIKFFFPQSNGLNTCLQCYFDFISVSLIPFLLCSLADHATTVLY